MLKKKKRKERLFVEEIQDLQLNEYENS